MGILDTIKGFFKGNKGKAKDAVDKVADAAQAKAPDQHDAKIDAAAEKAKDIIDKID